LLTSDEYSGEITRKGIYQEDPRSVTHPRTKTRELTPWYGHRSAALWWDHASIFDAWPRLVFQKPP